MPGLAPDESFNEGFDKYGEAGVSGLTTALIMGEWTSVSTSSGSFSIVAPLSGDGSGQAMRIRSDNNPSSGHCILTKILGGTYTRVCGGVTFKDIDVANGEPWGVVYYDGGTAQFAITLNAAGTISLKRGDEDGTVIATSAEAPGLGTINTLEWDVILRGTGAASDATVYLNTLPLTNLNGLTGLDLVNSANAQFTTISLRTDHTGELSDRIVEIDHLYNNFYIDPDDADAGCLLTNPVVDTDYIVSDFELDFTPMQAILGQPTRYGSSVATPAAGSLILRKFTAVGDGTLETMTLVPNATNASAKFKGVIYSDNGSGTAPNVLLDTGAEITGCTTGVILSSDMNSEPIVDGTIYWIGFIMDTSLSLQLRDATAVGYRAANTYASGAPDPAPAMTSGQGSWLINGYVVPTEGWPALRQNPPTSLSYNQSVTVGHRHLGSFDALTVSPAEIHNVAYKVNLRRTDAGARTVKVVCRSNAAEADGDTVAPATSGTWVAGYFPVDPETGLEWGSADMQAAYGGVEIVS